MTLTANQRAAMVKKVEGHLDPGEKVLDVTFGALHVPRKGRPDRTRARAVSLLVTDRRIFFFRKKWRGYELYTMRYDKLETVDHSKGPTTGELRLAVTGRDVARVSSLPSDDVERLANLIRDRSGS